MIRKVRRQFSSLFVI